MSDMCDPFKQCCKDLDAMTDAANEYEERAEKAEADVDRLNVELDNCSANVDTMTRAWKTAKYLGQKAEAELVALQRALMEAIHLGNAEINEHKDTKTQRDELKAIVQLTVESQGWDGNNPDDDRWANLYKRAREALEGKP